MASSFGNYFSMFVLQIGTIAGFIQGLSWSILSLTAIIWHICGSYNETISYQDPYPTLLQTYLYYSFIKNNGGSTYMYIQPGGFCAVMICYFALSVGWLGVSAYAYAAFKKRYSNKKVMIALAVWTAIALATIILDAVFCSLLAVDYHSVLNEYSRTTDMVRKLAYTYSTIGYGIVMVLAARGFVLWVINVILTGTVIKICIDLIYNPPTDHNDTIFSTFPRRPCLGNLPVEFRNDLYEPNLVQRRHQQEPTPSNDVLSTTSTVLRVYKGINYTFDPEVEARLSKYNIDPKPVLKHRAV